MPTEQDLIWWQGSTWRATLDWATSEGVLKDLTGYRFYMQVRKKYADIDVDGPYVDIDSDLKGGITVTPATGHVELVVPGDVIALMPKGGYVWDLDVLDPQDAPDKLYYGRVTVNPEVTRE